jgi:hypothetical protein
MIQVADEAESEYDGTPSAVRTAFAVEKLMAKPSEGNVRSEATDLRCLSLCIGMLERVIGVCMISFAVENHTETPIFRRSKKT